jgi:hypothetical protein
MYRVPEPHHEWIASFLTVRAPSSAPMSWFSCFSAAVRDAREATGRSPNTGVLERPVQAGNWLGTLGYLVILDLVGECFRPVSAAREPVTKAAVVRALTYFAQGLSDDVILAIYALRCALAHDYGLINIGNGPFASRLHHAFLLINDEKEPVVALPTLRWNGELTAARRHRTVVNVRALGDLVERVVLTLQAGHRAGNLHVTLAGGSTSCSRASQRRSTRTRRRTEPAVRVRGSDRVVGGRGAGAVSGLAVKPTSRALDPGCSELISTSSR